MRQSVFYLSVTTLGLLGFVALATVHDPDPGLDVLLLWAVASLAALLAVTQGAAASVRGRQFAWLGALLAAGLVSILGLVVTFLIPTYPNWMLGGIRLVDLINVVPFLPACAGVVGRLGVQHLPVGLVSSDDDAVRRRWLWPCIGRFVTPPARRRLTPLRLGVRLRIRLRIRVPRRTGALSSGVPGAAHRRVHSPLVARCQRDYPFPSLVLVRRILVL